MLIVLQIRRLCKPLLCDCLSAKVAVDTKQERYDEHYFLRKDLGWLSSPCRDFLIRFLLGACLRTSNAVCLTNSLMTGPMKRTPSEGGALLKATENGKTNPQSNKHHWQLNRKPPRKKDNNIISGRKTEHEATQNPPKIYSTEDIAEKKLTKKSEKNANKKWTKTCT